MFDRIIDSVFDFLPGRPVLLLTGARRVGKTTFLRRWFATRADPKRWIDGDDPAERVRWARLLGGQASGEWLQVLLGAVPSARRPATLVIDEAQALDGVTRVVKHLTDATPGLRVVLSGSSALVLKGLAAESLAGRKLAFELQPLSFVERIDRGRLTGLPHEDRQRFSALLLEMLVWGGFPELPALPDEATRARALREVVDAVLRRDLVDFLRERDARVLELLLLEIARGVGGKLSVSRLATFAGVSRPTVMRYLTLLSEAGLVYLLPGVRASGVVAKAQPKAYLLDNGLLSTLLHDTRPFELRRPEEQGALLENFVLTELVKHEGLRGSGAVLGYLWDAHAEIDFVLQREGAVKAAWEVKRGGRAPGPRARAALEGTVPVLVSLDEAPLQLLELWDVHADG